MRQAVRDFDVLRAAARQDADSDQMIEGGDCCDRGGTPVHSAMAQADDLWRRQTQLTADPDGSPWPRLAEALSAVVQRGVADVPVPVRREELDLQASYLFLAQPGQADAVWCEYAIEQRDFRLMR